MKVSDAVIEALKPYTDTVYVVPGGFSMHLNDSLNYSGLNVVYCLHEAGAGFAACGHAQWTGRLGVALVTSGPGSTNILTAVASAWQDSIPLLVISGDAKTERIVVREQYNLRQGGAQDVPILELASPITKYADRLTCSDMTSFMLDHAIQLALTPRRGSVWISIPLDVQEMQV